MTDTPSPSRAGERPDITVIEQRWQTRHEQTPEDYACDAEVDVKTLLDALRTVEQERDAKQALIDDLTNVEMFNNLRAQLTARDQTIAQLREALQSLVEDLEARWDMRDPRTNPGIRHYVEQARKALTPPADGPITWYPCACGAEHDTPTCPFGAADGPRT